MINAFRLKRFAALTIMPMFVTIGFYVGIAVYNNFMIGLGLMAFMILITFLISRKLLQNPFSDLLDGKGLLAIDMSSTGILQPFIMGVEDNYLIGNLRGKKVKDTFDRNAIHQLAVPKKVSSKATMSEKGLEITLTKDEYNDGRFALYHYPVILYNSQLKTVITKDFLSSQERSIFAEHNVLYLNRKMEELTVILRDFGRSVVELIKPDKPLMQNWLFWIVIIIGGGILLWVFAPSIMASLGSVTQGVQTATGAGGGIVMPQ